MKRFFFVLESLIICISLYAQSDVYTDGAAVAVRSNLPLNELKGSLHVLNKKGNFEKAKNISFDIFDYVFLCQDGYVGGSVRGCDLFLFPLGSGKYENKEQSKILWIKMSSYDDRDDFVRKYLIFSPFEDQSLSRKGSFYNRYGGQRFSYTSPRITKGYKLLESSFLTCDRKPGMLYQYFFDEKSYYGKGQNRLKTKENEKDVELAKRICGYEVIFNRSNSTFGVVDITNSKTYWGENAKAYLDASYTSTNYKRAIEDIKKRKIAEEAEEKERAYPCGWAYFSDKGRGNIKYKFNCVVENQSSTIVFSGFNKNDKVIDEVFVLPPANGKVETDPSVIPAKVTYLQSYFQQGVNFYYIYAEELDLNGDNKDKKLVRQGYELYTTQTVLEEINNELNNNNKWQNKSGVKYYHRDRWGNSHIL